MLLVDTSAWIEWLIGSRTGVTVERFIPDREAWLVPTRVQLERVQWLTREAGGAKADQAIAFTQMSAVAPLDTRSRSWPPRYAPDASSPPPTASSTQRHWSTALTF